LAASLAECLAQMSVRFYDIDGNVIKGGVLEWGKLLEDTDYRSLGFDEQDGVTVSTVWLGLNHGPKRGPNGNPLIFETMIFGGDLSGCQERYATKEGARAGHKRWCQDAFKKEELK